MKANPLRNCDDDSTAHKTKAHDDQASVGGGRVCCGGPSRLFGSGGGMRCAGVPGLVVGVGVGVRSIDYGWVNRFGRIR